MKFIIRSVRTVHFSFVLNGDVKGSIILERTLSKRPSLPLPFPLLLGGLLESFSIDEVLGSIKDLRFGNPGISISHFFSDDSLLSLKPLRGRF